MYIKTILKELQDKKITPEEAKIKLDKLKQNNKADSGESMKTDGIAEKAALINHSLECNDPIAIVGISGRYPHSNDMEEYWDNLSNGVSCIREIPDSRWNMKEYYDPAIGKEGKIYCKFLGMLDDIECFDPLFFEITPIEAETMDPQHRLFLEEGYRAFEDAGYSKRELNNKKCGVYLGIVDNEYSSLVGNSLSMEDNSVSATGNSHAIGASRIAYYLNLKGPAIAVDTACSSSAVAVHLASQALHNKEIEMALVGGVCLYLTPESYISMCSTGMLSSEGKCKTFDNSADGFVPGEGVGALVLKRLSDAVRDHDHIYGCIAASGMNQDGKTNGITAPHMGSQKELESSIYSENNINCESITYAEFHGTGTKLGDPIELEALASAFREKTNKKNYCAIGSVKSNLGHTSAAGVIAGIHKILLCMKHKSLVPTLNVKTPNEHFDFSDSPFNINQVTKGWKTADNQPLRACISSFGFSGTNVHLVIDEYRELQNVRFDMKSEDAWNIFTLSARNKERLQIYAKKMLDFIIKNKPDPTNFFFTLQTGREAMEERIAIVAGGMDDLKEKLSNYLVNGCNDDSMLQNRLSRNEIRLKEAAFLSDAGSQENQNELIKNLSKEEKLKFIAKKWIDGEIIDWIVLLYNNAHPYRIPVPAYPFEKKAYWVKKSNKTKDVLQLHPLVHQNVSDFGTQCFQSDFSGNEFYIADHNVGGSYLLPGAAMLEMARVAGELSSKCKVGGLKDIEWLLPVEVPQTGRMVCIKLYPDENQAGFIITTKESPDLIFAQGGIVFQTDDPDMGKVTAIDISGIKQRCTDISASKAIYPAMAKAGINYGESFRVIEEIYSNKNEALSHILLNESIKDKAYVLHPALLDGAMQTVSALIRNDNAQGVYMPFMIGNIQIFAELPDSGYAYVRESEKVNESENSTKLFDVTITDENGKTIVVIRDLCLKQSTRKSKDIDKMVFYTPDWEEKKQVQHSSTKQIKENEALLVFADDTEMSDSIKEVLEASLKNNVVLIKTGESYVKESEYIYRINPCSMEDYTSLFGDMANRGLVPCKIIFSLLTKDLQYTTESKLKFGFESIMTLSKALINDKYKGEVKLLYLINNDKNMIPEDNALSGMFRAIHRENTRFYFKTVGIDRAALPDNIADILLCEFTNSIISTEVSFVNGKRYVKRFIEAENHDNEDDVRLLKDGGVYLITGGMGGIGLITAEYLAQLHDTKIILAGRSKIDETGIKKIKNISRNGSRIEYIQADVARKSDCVKLISSIKERYGGINGVIHAAGTIRDSLIWRKSTEEAGIVLAAKVFGTKYLDEAIGEEPIDFMVLCSSLASALGNIGQCDYCYGNSYMDYFAVCRNKLVTRGMRQGRTISINWCPWDDAGMNTGSEFREWIKNNMGIIPINGLEGMEALETAIKAGLPQIMVLKGNTVKIRSALVLTGERNTNLDRTTEQGGISKQEKDAIREQTIKYLKNVISTKTKIQGDKIDPVASFGDYGIDSIIILSITRAMEQNFGYLSKTLFFEYNNLNELADYFIENHMDKLYSVMDSGDNSNSDKEAAYNRNIPEKTDKQIQTNRFLKNSNHGERDEAVPNKIQDENDIAIIGISGRYPMADNLEEYWENLKRGMDCITEIPDDRWDHDEYFDEDRNKIGKAYSKWGGFINDVDKFDPLFFNIPPVEAKFIDPQIRLSLQSAWQAMEDAGYTRESLAGSRVGVFIGVMYGMYQLYKGELNGAIIPATSSYSAIANRISYFFDFHGPSMSIDTMCSSSLTALHLACESLKRRESEIAFVGGVNLSIHPDKYLILSFGKFASSDGRCRSFGEGGDGYVPGEGVGTIIIKPLKEAIRDKDNIYAVIKATAINAGGKASGFTVPSPIAQSDVIGEVYKKAEIDVRTVSYIETHGTGTSLGDPIEINGLSKVFGVDNTEKQYCAIGSVKSNIGHLEGAAGIAGLTKVILQMKHHQLVPSLHSTVLNPYINFKNTPFYVQQELAEWKDTVYIKDQKEVRCPRRAGISSFGAGGSNAHVLLEEYESKTADQAEDTGEERLYLFSARNEERLKEYVKSFVKFLNAGENNDSEYALELKIIDILAQASGISSKDFDPNRDIEEYGLNFAYLTELQNWLLQVLEVNAVFGGIEKLRTIHELAVYIQRNLGCEYIKRAKSYSACEVAYILQGCREAMEERLAVTAFSLHELSQKLNAWLKGTKEVEGLIERNILDYKEGLAGITKEATKVETVESMLSGKKYEKLADLWTAGVKINWIEMYGKDTPYKMSLPVYPFAKEQCWVKTPNNPVNSELPGNKQIHPVLHENISDIYGLCFRTDLTGNERILLDHKINGKKVLPGVVYLEMVRAAVVTVLGKAADEQTVDIKNIAWISPAVVEEKGISLFTKLEVESRDEINFVIYSESQEDKSRQNVHCHGMVVISKKAETLKYNPESLMPEHCNGEWTAEQVYPCFRQAGIEYGTSFQCVNSLCQDGNKVLASLCIDTRDVEGEFVLIPGIIDSALQAAIAFDLGSQASKTGEDAKHGIMLPFALENVEIIAPCKENMWALLQNDDTTRNPNIKKLNIDIFDTEGNLCTRVVGLTFREFDTESKLENHQISRVENQQIMLEPVWSIKEIKHAGNKRSGQIRKIIVFGSDVTGISDLKDYIFNGDVEIIGLQDGDMDEKYISCSEVLLTAVKKLYEDFNGNNALLQVCLYAPKGELQILKGLSGFLMSMNLENPGIKGQMIIVEEQIDSTLLANYLDMESSLNDCQYIWYKDHKRYVQQLKEVVIKGGEYPDNLWREQGVYLITGGAGRLGMIMAAEAGKSIKTGTIILTGRSELMPDSNSQMENLKKTGLNVEYVKADVSDEESVIKLADYIMEKYGQLNGIIHSAGIVKDNLIVRKTGKELGDVSSPKVKGLYNLDKATHEFKLDFIILMSSSASVMGNTGQSDYAAANGFMDYFADYRNKLVASGERTGCTYSINWPLWRDGGMQIDSSIEEFIKENTGLTPLEKESGMAMMYEGISKGMVHFVPMQGDIEKIRNWVSPKKPEELVEAEQEQISIERYSQVNLEEVRGRLTNMLKEMLSSELGLPVDKIDARVSMEKYGMTSIMIMQLTRQLEKRFGSLPKTLLFEYETIQSLSGYLCESHAERVYEVLNVKRIENIKYESKALNIKNNILKTIPKGKVEKAQAVDVSRTVDDYNGWDIAIIGLAGKYPKSADVSELWENLSNGVDCVTEIPGERWNHGKYYSPDKTRSDRTYAKWGGFIDGIENFDNMFFHISPSEAESMDPQERLFLQCVYHAIEDAGYVHHTMARQEKHGLVNNVGVFVGVMYEEYQLYGAQAQERGNMYTLTGSEASIANRVSYIYGFHGPSMAVDTMCSSSLTALQLACKSILNNECEMAVAGGVNLSLHPNKFLMLGQTRFVSEKGRCEAFGEGGSGYVPGEGVGAIILKPMKKAIVDGDHIYGIIKGAALNHGGRTNGYTVPNPHAQTSVIKDAWELAGINPEAISYIEAHGTGTSLGDPIEISGLKHAFEGKTDKKQFCYIGSVKSNIGHCESAAGIAGIAKILLQIKYGKIVPSLHSSTLNSNINFEESPFIVPQELVEWNRPQVSVDGNVVTYPRIACISAFGAGGSNAHMVIEEYIPGEGKPEGKNRKQIPLIVLSAKTEEQLIEQARQLNSWVLNNLNSELADIAYTLLVGREAMDERLAFLAESVDDLEIKLEGIINGDFSGVHKGRVRNTNNILSIFDSDKEMEELLQKWLYDGKYTKLSEVWVKGLSIEWQNFFEGGVYKRLSLPGYSFAKERFWGPDREKATPDSTSCHSAARILHPLIHQNTSDFNEQRYTTIFDGDEPFLKGHLVSGKKTLPAVVFVEMVYEAFLDAMHINNVSGINVEFKDIVWIRPCIFEDKPLEVHVGLKAEQNGSISFRVYSGNIQAAKEEIEIYNTGTLIPSQNSGNEAYNLEELKNLNSTESADAKAVYSCFNKMELKYGKSQQGIEKISRGSHTLLAHLVIPEDTGSSMNEYTLYPAIMDSAIQACIGLNKDFSIFDQDSRIKEDEASISVPFMCRSITIYRKCEFSMWAYIRSGNDEGITDDINIDILDDTGNVCVSINHIIFRGIKERQGISDTVIFKPYLKKLSESSADKKDFVGKSVILCNLDSEIERQISKDQNWNDCLAMNEIHGTPAQSFKDLALQLFNHIKQKVIGKIQGNILIQVVVPIEGEAYVLGGISGLLKTVHLEKPQIYCQLIGVRQTDNAANVINAVKRAASYYEETVIIYQDGSIHTLTYNKLDNGFEETEVKDVFKDGEVYLITGGMGGLGRIFAREIASKAKDAVIVLAGRSELDTDKERVLEEINALGAECVYYSADMSSKESVNNLVQGVVSNFGALHGIIHCAGVAKDNFIYKKESSEFEAVLSPKVLGTWNLDEATKDMELKFFALFSSFSAITGNIGQVDYASGNSFMDFFSEYRNQLVQKKCRSGRTISFNWPFWKDGGIQLDSQLLDSMSANRGMDALTTETGIGVFYHTFQTGVSQIIVAQGNQEKIMGMFEKPGKKPITVEYAQNMDIKQKSTDNNVNPTDTIKDYIIRIFSELLRMPKHKILTDRFFDEYGVDSIFTMKLTETLEKDFGPLSKTLLFEYQTIDALTTYFKKNYREKLLEVFSFRAEAASTKESVRKEPARESGLALSTRFNSFNKVSYTNPQAIAKTDCDVAIIGISGRYPQADTIDELWQNLLEGRDCITEIPIERWDYRKYYNKDKDNIGTSYSKWGGFINDVEMFDPMFFKIPPIDARFMDPHERLFLQTVWEAVEDAGYTGKTLSNEKVGVFTGIMYALYQMYETNTPQGKMSGRTSFASVANRVSYFFDFKGPSIALDTMCSSSFTAIYLACESIRAGASTMAVAGGVNLSVHPNKYVQLSQGGFLSTDGRCRSFGEGGDGYVPGEGVGAVILKPLGRAIEDGDHIYGVIKAISINSGGKASGYTVPNLNAQRELIKETLVKGNIDARTISYVEAHGTGTSLGDPIEINAISQAYREYTDKPQYCSIGSLKSNIGHLESAAGIASLTKVLLQMKYKKLVPSLHSDKLNSYIRLEDSPFYVQHGISEWEQPVVDGKRYPRRAGISAFGAGGSNAHLVVEEYENNMEIDHEESGRDCLFVLSAKNEERLKEYARKIHAFIMKCFEPDLREKEHSMPVKSIVATALAEILGVKAETIHDDDSFKDLGVDAYLMEQLRESIIDKLGIEMTGLQFMSYYNVEQLVNALHPYITVDANKTVENETAPVPEISLENIAYTLQVGREAMDERVAIIASDYKSLLKGLEDYISDYSGSTSFKHGNVNDSRERFGAILNNEGIKEYLKQILKEGKIEEAMELWLIGAQLDWSILYADNKCLKVSLPTYPFANERHWIISEGMDDKVPPDGHFSDLKQNLPFSIEKQSNSIQETGKIQNLNDADLKSAMEEYIKQAFVDILKIPYEYLSSTKDYEAYGIDSIYIRHINKHFEQHFGSLPSTLLFTYKTIQTLADYFVNEHKNKVLQYLNGEQIVETENHKQVDFENVNYAISEVMSRDIKPEIQEEDTNDVAIIGISGRFPKAEGLDTYLKNLEEGKDCISEIPPERWNWRDYPEITCKWGGFIEDADKFDPQFFNIAPTAALFMDPQERLFLQSVWSCLEDAGYTPNRMEKNDTRDSRGNVAVYAGVTFNEYGLYGAGDIAKGKVMPLNSQIYSIANRISYLFNLGGPSLSVDTACSSSLYAIHLGCESILRGECDMAIAGGVNLSLHPSKYITLNWAKFLASDGHCRTFGKDGDGYVPGEGVGAVLLKPLKRAIQDRDHVYAVIKGSAVNHGGKTYGYSVPNPVAQSEIIEKALRKSGVNPRTISYVEAHGTGTALGDPIEISALTEAYKKYTQDKQYCAIGSVKSNIGHLEAASGISQLIKVILQMKNKELVPGRLNSDELNPNIDFESTPFYVQLKKEEWKRPVLGKEQKEYPRRAGISAFGVGGVNVHMIVEEYEMPYEPVEEVKEPVIIPLSAKNEKTLKNYVSSWLAYIKRAEDQEGALPDIRDAAYTMQNGRIELVYRAAFVANNYKQLKDMLWKYLNGDKCEGIYTGKASSAQLKGSMEDSLSSELEVTDSANSAADRWVQGKEASFDFMYREYKPGKVPLPGYPFEKEAYWLYSKIDNTDPSKDADVYADTEKREEAEAIVKVEENLKKESIIERLGHAYEDERMEITLRYIQDIFAQLLGFSEGRLPDVEEGFFALGLESVATRQAYNIIEDEFQVELDDQIFFDYPNIVEVSKYILSLLDLKRYDEIDASSNNIQSSKPSDNETLFFEHKWVLTEQLKSSKSTGKDKVLFVGMSDELTASIKGYASQGSLKNMFFVSNEEKPLEVLGKMKTLPDKIVFAAFINDQKKGISNIDYRMNEGVLKIFDMAKYLVNKAKKSISLLYIYENADDIVSAEYGAMSGFFKTLHMENSRLMYKIVSICGDMKDNNQIANTIIKEVKAGCTGEEIAYRNKKRYEKRICELSSEAVSGPCLFKEGGVYLLVGGNGGLAKIISKHLSRKYHANLIISGRKESSEENGKQLKDIEALGGKAFYIKADISVREDVENLVRKATECFGHVDGVIHAAGVIRDAMIQNKTTEDFKTVLAPKVYGTQYLDEALKDKEIDFFVIFSSLASVIGNIGQSDYCYANSFIDNFAQVRNMLREEGLRSGKTYSINWSFWQNGGMTIDGGIQKWMDKKLGLLLMDDERGIEALEKSMKSDTSQVILMNGRPKKIREAFQIVESNDTNQEIKDENNIFLEVDKLPEEIEEMSEENVLDLLEMFTTKNTDD